MNRHRDVLVLSHRDIAQVLDLEEALPIVEQAFRAYRLGKAVMPPKIYLPIKRIGDYRAMPASFKDDWAGVKWVSVYPQNVLAHLPTVLATIILNDAHTGMPVAIMDGTYITKIRTGAAGGVAAKYLARPDSRCVGLVGCGVQADMQLQVLEKCFSIQRVLVWGPRAQELRSFVRYQQERGVQQIEAAELRVVVQEADILVTTTPSRKPLVRRWWLRSGVHINAIGADAKGKQELDPKILLDAIVVVDDWMQASHSGEINVAVSRGLVTRRHIAASLGDVVSGLKRLRRRSSDITVFDSTGLAVQDLAMAAEAYLRCRRRHLGFRVSMGE